jgi:hypothetical protein
MSRISIRKLTLLSALFLTIGAYSAIATTDAYRFELVGPPSATVQGHTITVRLVSVPSGQAVANADVYRHEYGGYELRSLAGVSQRTTRLTPNNDGTYTLTTKTPLSVGATLNLDAWVPGESRTIRGVVHVGTAN